MTADRKPDDFARQVEGKGSNMAGEFFGMLRHNKKWWLTPLVVAAVLLGAFMLLFGTPLSPLIYTLF